MPRQRWAAPRPLARAPPPHPACHPGPLAAGHLQALRATRTIRAPRAIDGATPALRPTHTPHHPRRHHTPRRHPRTARGGRPAPRPSRPLRPGPLGLAAQVSGCRANVRACARPPDPPATYGTTPRAPPRTARGGHRQERSARPHASAVRAPAFGPTQTHNTAPPPHPARHPDAPPRTARHPGPRATPHHARRTDRPASLGPAAQVSPGCRASIRAAHVPLGTRGTTTLRAPP